MKIPKSVQEIMNCLNNHGYQCYLVGGCVRDHLLKRPIHDYDLTTNALPTTILSLFQDYSLVTHGIKHGTIGVETEDGIIEITTHRKESNYLDHRHPSEVSFTQSLSDDLARRDFTINAMAMDQSGHLYDKHNGLLDLKKKQIACVGNPMKRFEEDALRIMRCVRFSMQLQFSIEENTLTALKKQAHLLTYVSKERIRDEFHIMLLSHTENILTTLQQYQILPIIFPLLSKMNQVFQPTSWHMHDLLTHTDIELNHSKDDSLILKLALCFHNCGKLIFLTCNQHDIDHCPNDTNKSIELTKQVLKEYHYSKQMIKQILLLIKYHDYYIQENKAFLRDFLMKLNYDHTLANFIIKMQYCDYCAKHPSDANEKIAIVKNIQVLLRELEQEQPITLHDLAITGKDIIKLGFQGKDIGFMKQQLLTYVIKNPSHNQKAILLEYLKKQFPS